MAGYAGYSKSNNALIAESEGKMTATAAAKWAREELGLRGCTAADIRRVVRACEWHHTSKKYNRTDYYDSADVEDLRDDIAAAIETRKRNKKSGISADVDRPIISFSECGLVDDPAPLGHEPLNEWYVALLKNGQLAAAQNNGLGDWAKRPLTPGEHEAAKQKWPYDPSVLDRELAQ